MADVKKKKKGRGHESLGDPAKDLRLVELLEKELKLKKAKIEEDDDGDADARQEVARKLEDFVEKCNALGTHYSTLEPPNFTVSRKLHTTAEAVVKEGTPYRAFFATEATRLRLLSGTYQSLGALEKAAEQLKQAVDYHTKAIEVEMKLKEMKERGLDQAPPQEDTKRATKLPAVKTAESTADVDNKLLLQACRKGHTEQAIQIIRRRTANLDVADSAANTALHHACQNRMTQVVQELCKPEPLSTRSTMPEIPHSTSQPVAVWS